MRIGNLANLSGGDASNVDKLVDFVQTRAREGASTVWFANLRNGIDALTVIAVAGRSVPHVELGTAVVPVYTRHPMVMAQQALTTQAATGGRLTLGIGLSHKPVVEGSWGLSFERPVEYLAEYLAILMPLLRGEAVEFDGQRLTAHGEIGQLHTTPPSVLVAALGPRMLRLAGQLTDGTVTWMVGPRTLEAHIVPGLAAAASGAGRPAPRVVVGLPMCVTSDLEAGRARANRIYERYGTLPSYRAMLDREGVAGPADVCLIGTEDAVREQLAALERAGATDFYPAVFGSADEQARAYEFLRTVAADGRLAAV